MSNLIEFAIFDVDGVFTDGTFQYNSETKVQKTFGPHDADALKFLRYNGVTIQAVSADKRGFGISRARMQDMNIPLTYVSEQDRYRFLSKNFIFKKSFFMGDGLHDARVLREVKVGICPSNACSHARKNASYVTKRAGGNGAVMEAVEWLVENGYLRKTFEEYLNE